MLDFVPNLAFLVGAYFLVRWVRLTSNRLSVVAMIAGSSLVFLGGTLKAIWKLLYTIGIGDFWLLSELQFILLAPGFLAMLASVLLVLKQERKSWKPGLLAMAPWKIPLLATMTLGSLGLQGILSYMAFRRKAYLAATMYIVAILCVLGLAGLTGGEQSIARQWIEEGTMRRDRSLSHWGATCCTSRTEMVWD
jgi:hypothetical protein